MLDAYLVGQGAQKERNHRTSEARRHQESRSLAGHGAQARDSQCEDVGEHNGVEEAAKHEGPDRDLAAGEHGSRKKCSRGDAKGSEQLAGWNPGQDPGAE